MPRPRLSRPVCLLLEPMGTEPDFLGTLRKRAAANQRLFADLDQLLRDHALPASPELATLGPALPVLLTSQGLAWSPLPAAAVPLLI
ncbi:hypothetical protein [Deinococcus multiflagellatus]|uniref:Uncharacterized protein n=1 Tax=Deinococcus multiflagellatus TaxID=1656887 RepID=A0ABW1ZTI0_9DEIO|nr:hypothetical protein [Deinococcus multiflagellatus]MBZ9714476.1 hypothetical protein [Deinococcus multiflagellatus]